MDNIIEDNWTNWKDMHCCRGMSPEVVWEPSTRQNNWLSGEPLSAVKKKRILYGIAKKTKQRKDL